MGPAIALMKLKIKGSDYQQVSKHVLSKNGLQ